VCSSNFSAIKKLLVSIFFISSFDKLLLFISLSGFAHFASIFEDKPKCLANCSSSLFIIASIVVLASISIFGYLSINFCQIV
jgi:hypothetical protein